MRALSTIAAALLVLAGCSDGSGPGPEDTWDDGELEPDVGDDVATDTLEEEDVADEDVLVDVPEEPDPEWEAFLAEREDHLRTLSDSILHCTAQHDTSNPCFHGCVDWHSAVEGVWALLALTRVTGDTSFAEAADVILETGAVDAELAQLEAGGPVPTEIPYGYSWFLTLARERERGGEMDLRPLADVASTELETYVAGLSRGQIDGTIQSDDYTNLSWVVLNLYLWAEWTDDTDLMGWLETFTRTEILPREFFCPLSSSPDRILDFFPPCLHRAWVILTVLPPGEAAGWVETGVPEELDLVPLSAPPDAHTAGLNFSRCWGLWALWEGTGEQRFRTLYREHIETHIAMPEYWRDDYMMHSHWIPQFGVFAILRSYD